MVAALLLFTVIASTWKVELTVFQARMTTTFAVVCLTLLLQGVRAAVLCAIAGAMVGIFSNRRQGTWKIQILHPAWYRILLNLANCAISCSASAILFTTAERYAPNHQWAQVIGLALFTACYFVLNTAGIALAICFQQGKAWSSVWRQNFLWTAPGFFASASAAAGVQAVYRVQPALSIMAVPILYFVYSSYRLYMERLHLYSERVQQDMAHIEELNRLNQAVIASLATAIDAKDRYTCSHINRVQHYAIALAKKAGISGPELDAVATGALVHDIGKLGIPDHILAKPGKLSPEEFRRIQTHVSIGAEILKPVPFPFPVVEVVMTHHERWDGLGYPCGIKGEDIPMGGRIISIVDVYDALTSDRPYRRAMSPEEALKVMKEAAGKQFDPRLVDIFAEILPDLREEIETIELKYMSGTSEENAPTETVSALNQISQAAAEMAAVCDVAQALSEQDTIDGVLRVVLDRCFTLMPADTVVLYLTSPSSRNLIAVAVEGKYRDKLAGMTIEVGEGVAGWVAKHQQPLVNVAAALDVARRFTPEETMELSAATAVPLVHGPDDIGVLAAYTQGYSVLSDHHLHVLNILAEHAAAAIQNLRRIERNQEMAFTDPLTGLANSRCLFRHLDRFCRAEESRPGTVEFSVVMLDLDGFKEVNDTLGHMRGDDVLRMVAERIAELGRPEDVACRYAGDEFVLLLPNCGSDQAQDVVARVRSTVESMPLLDESLKVGASVGAATFPMDGKSGRELLHAADQRMYEDKFQRRSDPTLVRSSVVSTFASR